VAIFLQEQGEGSSSTGRDRGPGQDDLVAASTASGGGADVGATVRVAATIARAGGSTGGTLGGAGAWGRDIETTRVGVVGGQQQLQGVDTGLGICGHGPDQVTDTLGAIDGTDLLDIERVIDVVRVHEIDFCGRGCGRGQGGRGGAGHGPGKGLVGACSVRNTFTHGLSERDVVQGSGCGGHGDSDEGKTSED